MIKQVSRKKLDLDKYTSCLLKSINYHIYAESWYLDTLLAENWDCLVYNDYEAIMPLPFVRKLGVKFIIQPLYCQQLGVFHQEGFPENIFHKFEKKLHRKLVRAYHFNEENTAMFSPKGKLKVNQTLNLSSCYETLYGNFNSNRKRNIKSNEHHQFRINQSTFDVEWHFDTMEKNYDYSKNINLTLFKSIINKNIERRNITQYLLFDKNETVISSVFLLHSSNKIILLSSVRHKEVEPKGSFSYLLGSIIRDYSNHPLILDFEGSNIKGIQNYYASYNSKTNYYCSFKNIF